MPIEISAERRVEELDPYRVVRRGRQHFLRRRPAPLFELLLGPAARDHQPGAGTRALGGAAQPCHRLGDGQASIQLTSTE
jgi:hypothetical protein